MFGRAAVDNYVRNAAPGCDQWEGRGGIHRQSRSQRDDEIRLHCGRMSPFKLCRIEVLSEADGRRL